MHPMWRATTYLYLTAAVSAVLMGSARHILTAASLAGLLALHAAVRCRLNALTPVEFSATASHAPPGRLRPSNPGSDP